ncbi:MAG: hypothetical protein OQK05_07995 [Pseudopelagicola sp.]|nr:hypothetical protein [Pseudopelagicola sp.]
MTDHEGNDDKKEQSADDKIEALTAYLVALGLEDLARDISEERFARRVVEARIAYDYHSLQSEIWKDRHDKALEFEVSRQAALFDKAATYNNVVVTLGYAGFFSVWSLVSQELSRTENAFVGLTLGFSLLVFIAWTLTNSTLLTVNFRRYAVIEGTEFSTFEEALDAHKSAEDKTKRAVLRLQRFWPYVFVSSTVPALAAGATVLAELLFQLGGVELRLVDRVWSHFQ